jgi:hypothetical protein
MERSPLRDDESGIPEHRADGTLPPFVGDQKDRMKRGAPYHATLEQVLERLVTSPGRARIFSGYLDLSAELHAEGIQGGFQWVGGSFVERGPEPNDIDLVTFFERPRAWTSRQIELEAVTRAPHLFTQAAAKQRFSCDAFYVDASCDAARLVRWTTKWYSLYAHGRDGRQWKGFLWLDFPPLDAIERARRKLAAHGQ